MSIRSGNAGRSMEPHRLCQRLMTSPNPQQARHGADGRDLLAVTQPGRLWHGKVAVNRVELTEDSCVSWHLVMRGITGLVLEGDLHPQGAVVAMVGEA